MRVCKMQLPHLGDGLKCVLLGPSKENVFLFISVELVTHILKVWWLCSLLWFLILAVACNSSEYKSAKCPPAGFVDRFQSCHWQVSNCKSATGRKRPSTAKETCFDYSRCEKWWFLRYMKLSYFLNTQNIQWWQSRATPKWKNPSAAHSSLPQSTGAVLNKTHNGS